MGERTVEERSLMEVLGLESADLPSARGEDTFGACLLDWLPSRETDRRFLPLPPATVICCALPYEALLFTEPEADLDAWPGIMTWTGLPLPAGVLAAN